MDVKTIKQKTNVFNICVHFGKIKNVSKNEIKKYWPQYLDSIATPELIDLLPSNFFIEPFGYCYFCNNFEGYSKMDYRTNMYTTKIIPISGKCLDSKKIVSVHHRCVFWNLKQLYNDILLQKIKTQFDGVKNSLIHNNCQREFVINI